MTWNTLANKVAGYQNIDGFATFANTYLHSPKFFQADGGYRRVVWMTDQQKKIAGSAIPEEYRSQIATENDATTLKELEKFLEINR